MDKKILIYTNDTCVGCNKCIKYCPGPGVNNSVNDGNKSRIIVNGDKCIHCGQCLKECEHNARNFSDDLVEVLEGLSRGEKIVLMVAPSLFLTYPEEAPYIIGYLRALGFVAIYDVSVGANLCTWATVKYIKNTGRFGLISSACPVVVDYIEKYKPNLIPRLMPIMSPAGCLRTYLENKVYADSEDEIKYAFLGPCIGKHDEYTTYPDGRKLDYTFTYKSVLSYFDDHKDELRKSGRSDCDYLRSSGLGRFFPIPGGLKNNLQNFMGYGYYIKHVEGVSNVCSYLEVYETMMKSGDSLPLVIDVLNCEGGCNEGVATDTSIDEAEIIMTRVHRNSMDVADNSHESPFDASISPKERFEIMDSFISDEEGLDYRDFMRSYNEKAAITEQIVPDEEIDNVFLKMNKITPADRMINCTSCGYKNCRAMAEAIYRGYNTPENCVHYVKNALTENVRQLEQLLATISGENESDESTYMKSEQVFQALQKAIIEVESQREALNNTIQARTQMFANLTHELRTPLNAIMNMTELLDKRNLSEEQLNNVNSISTAGNSLMDTINEILDFSKFEAGKFNIVEDKYYLHDLLTEVVTVMSFRCADKNLQFIRKLDPTTPDELIGDFKRIRQVMINCIGNAVKYTSFGSVTIDASWNHDMDNPVLITSVTDTGIGIKEEDLPYLFDSYRQVNETESKHIIGTGLGLSISKNITESMGGTLTVKSQYQVGSTFTMTLPQKMENYVPISELGRRSVKPGKTNDAPSKEFVIPTLKVLVVDDININVHIARTFMDRLQIYVDGASSGKEAIEKCSSQKYGLIFLDYLMPEMNGLEVAKIIKGSDNPNKDTVIICMSALDEGSKGTEFTDVFDEQLEKPIKKEALHELLQRLTDTNSIIYDSPGTIPSDTSLKNIVAAKDEKALLLAYASIERYAKCHNNDDLFRAAKKYRIMLQQGKPEAPFKNINSVLKKV